MCQIRVREGIGRKDNTMGMYADNYSDCARARTLISGALHNGQKVKDSFKNSYHAAQNNVLQAEVA